MGRFVQGSGYDLIFSSDLGNLGNLCEIRDVCRGRDLGRMGCGTPPSTCGARSAPSAPTIDLPDSESKNIARNRPVLCLSPQPPPKVSVFKTSAMTTPAIQTPSVQTPPIPQGAGSATVPSILPLRSAGQKDGNSLGTFNVSCTPAYMKIAYLITFVGEIGFGTDVEGVLDRLRLCMSRSVLK